VVKRDLVLACLNVSELPGSEHRAAHTSDPEDRPVEFIADRDNVRLVIGTDAPQAGKRLSLQVGDLVVSERHRPVLSRRQLRVDTAAAKGVNAPPTAWNVEQLQPADSPRQCGVDDEVVAYRFETEHGSE
jgi:hypothetical protein